MSLVYNGVACIRFTHAPSHSDVTTTDWRIEHRLHSRPTTRDSTLAMNSLAVEILSFAPFSPPLLKIIQLNLYYSSSSPSSNRNSRDPFFFFSLCAIPERFFKNTNTHTPPTTKERETNWNVYTTLTTSIQSTKTHGRTRKLRYVYINIK